MQSNASTMVKTYIFLWLPTGFGKSATRLPFVSTTSTVTLELAVVVYRSRCRITPCVSDNGSYHRINTAATLQAVYLVWLFLQV